MRSTAEQFVNFWSMQYRYKLDTLYDDNIGKILESGRVRDLFKWKNGGKLSKKKANSINKHFIARLGDLAQRTKGKTRKAILEDFGEGGAVWRIFFLHCWNQERFPIFDQHVYRAMRFITVKKPDELPKNDDTLKVHIYLNEYVPFLDAFKKMPSRQVDRALWAYGKFLKQYPTFNFD